MARLAGEVRETVLLATMERGKRSILCQVNGNEVFQIRDQFLLRQDVYRTATGRLLLAHLSPEELRSFVAGNGLPGEGQWPEAASKVKLAAALERIRSEGKVITLADLVGVAFPIFESGRVVAALGLFLPRERFKREHRNRILKQMAGTAALISSQLEERQHGYHRQGRGQSPRVRGGPGRHRACGAV
jgi:DNA-binding IclR family transcriptional regulator